MTDIMKRLHAEATDNRRYEVTGTLAIEAADEIARLRTQNAELVGLVVRAQRIIDPCCPEASHQWQKDTRTALASLSILHKYHNKCVK